MPLPGRGTSGDRQRHDEQNGTVCHLEASHYARKEGHLGFDVDAYVGVEDIQRWMVIAPKAWLALVLICGSGRGTG